MPTENSTVPPRITGLCELAGRDRAIATRLRDEAARLVKLAEALEANAGIANAAAAEMLAD